MKKITKAFFAISLSTAIIFQNISVLSYGEEIYQDSTNSTYESTSGIDELVNPLSTDLSASKPFSYPEANFLGKVTTGGLNVRELPSTSSKILSTLNEGNIIQILSKENDWYKISYFYRQQVSDKKYDIIFKEAYVSAKYISILSIKEKGIDVSEHNGKIDWNKVKASGIDYAIIRGGYGTDYVDPLFKTNIEGAIKAGLKIGVYWFSYASSPEKAIIEAKKCLQVIEPYKNNISYPVFFDFEKTSADWVKATYKIDVTKSLGTSMAKAFMDTIESQGYNTGLYTGVSLEKYFSEELLNSSFAWLAQYSYRTSYTKQFTMWQYCEDGYVNGIPGCVDINYTYTNQDEETIYRLDIHSFLGEDSAKLALKQLQDETGWYATYNKMNNKEYFYQIRTGGFVGETNVKNALDILYKTTGLKGYYKHEGQYSGGSKTPTYRIETGGFLDESSVKDALKWLQDSTGWYATYVPHGSGYKIVTGEFIGEDNVKNALSWMQKNTGWWAKYTSTGKYYETPSEPIYHIYLNETLSENNTINILNDLRSKMGWYATYSKTSNYVDNYQIITGGFKGLKNAQIQSEYIKNKFGWYNTIIKN